MASAPTQTSNSKLPDGRTFIEVAQAKLAESAKIKEKILNSRELLSEIQTGALACVESLQNGGCIFFCGNGGSAADAQHLSAELSGRFYYNRKPLKSEALHANTSFLTAVANDFSYGEIYSRLLEAQGRKGDVMICLSTSGNSENVVLAAKKALEMGITPISFTGEKGGKLKEICNIHIPVPSLDTARIQECHITIGHILCEIIECAVCPI
jgi:D-sedoheptulose 7-phosphate isomerase